jgi:pilus assembly protein CpaB
MNGKSLMMLGLAIVFGLGAMLLSRQMLSQDSGKQAEETQEVLVAARDIKEEELLKPDLVQVTRMAKSAVPPGSFSSPKDIEERWVKTTLLEGDVLVEKKLGPKGMPPGLVANIPKGMRAYALDVTEQSGVSGFVLPGHRVDVVRFETEKNIPRGDTILQDVLVLASGQVFTRAEERTLATRTVTLAVTPDQVDTLVAARSKGTLSLSLRGVNDHEVVARPISKTQDEDSLEQRWKLEEERRKQLEKELAELKGTLTRMSARPPIPQTVPPRYTTVYRGIDQVRRIRIDQAAVAELASRPDRVAKLETRDRQEPFGSPPIQDSLAGDLDQP